MAILKNTVIDGHLIPANNELFDLGTANGRFRDMYLSGSTIDLGGARVSIDANTGTVAIVGKPTENVPNPKALIITTEGKTVTSNTTNGTINVAEIESVVAANTGFSGELLQLNTVEEFPPETLNFTLDAHGMGSTGSWAWSWLPNGNPYSRTLTTDQLDPTITIHKKGIYTWTNKASNLNVTSVIGATHVHNAFIKWVPGAGANNLVDGVVYSNTTINGNTVQTLAWTIPETFGNVSPTLTSPNVNITFEGMMTHAGGGAPAHWHVDESHNYNEEIIVYRGGTYRFQVVGSENNHPLYLTTSSNAAFVSGQYVGEYLIGVSGSRAISGNTLTWVVAANTPNNVYYSCGNHGTMRGNIVVRNLQTNLSANGIPKVYLQHLKNGMYNEITIDEPLSADLPMSFLWKDSQTGKWIPKNFVDYANTTSEFINWVAGQADSRINANKTVLERHYNKIGNLTVSAGTQRWYVPSNITLTGVQTRLGTAPEGSNARFVILKNGSNFLTLNILSGQTSTILGNLSSNINTGDYISVDTAAFGSGVPGADLTVTFLYTRN